MDTTTTLLSRKSVRSYTGEAISAAEMEAVLQAAQAAPVGRGLYENVHLTVIQNPELLKEIDAKAAQAFGRADSHPLYGAPALVLVSAKNEAGQLSNVEYSNAAIIVQNMALQATELGIGCCHIWGAVRAINADAQLGGKLQLPAGFVPCCGITLGATPETYPKREVPADRISLNRL